MLLILTLTPGEQKPETPDTSRQLGIAKRACCLLCGISRASFREAGSKTALRIPTRASSAYAQDATLQKIVWHFPSVRW
jgi:hypothetical protein